MVFVYFITDYVDKNCLILVCRLIEIHNEKQFLIYDLVFRPKKLISL